MSEVSTMERVIRSDVSMEECKKIEKVLRKNNISYFERWKLHTGLLRFLNNDKNAKCDILVHMDSFERELKHCLRQEALWTNRSVNIRIQRTLRINNC